MQEIRDKKKSLSHTENKEQNFAIYKRLILDPKTEKSWTKKDSPCKQ